MKNDSQEFVMQILIKVMPELINSRLQIDDELYAHCGMDSRIFLQLIREIEEHLGCDVNDEDLLEAELVTINDLANFVEKIANSKNLQVNNE